MNHSSSRQSMFLMEIIIAILFFSLVSAVCLRLFTGARQMSQDTGNLHRAVNQAQNAAELLTYGCTRGESSALSDAESSLFPQALLLEYPDAVLSREASEAGAGPADFACADSAETAPAGAGEMIIYYDQDWTPSKGDVGVYCMRIYGTEEDSLALYRIAVSGADGEEIIFSLELKLHRPIRPAF